MQNYLLLSEIDINILLHLVLNKIFKANTNMERRHIVYFLRLCSCDLNRIFQVLIKTIQIPHLQFQFFVLAIKMQVKLENFERNR